ncbi:hypothetical protein CBR_g70691 [Chara braunii]|uniref:Uncharacterized protein n=1 Tax=Chara braunii TaxID=69332 RepID=A0A388KA45_CHABU|nr:hypothetical protein CBR_g70691 [Chara braunii]|eukprot:GBG66813.1 hypothetical protein CBR_g70691 [Chara braunii]
MVNNDTRQIGKILRRYDEMIVRCLFTCATFAKEEKDAVLKVVFDTRRTKSKSPAHVVAMMLDLEFRDYTLPDDDEIQHGLKVALVQFGYPKGSHQHNEVLPAIDKFHAREPPFDNMVMDQAARSYPHPANFWEWKEKRFPHTTFFVGRILRAGYVRPRNPRDGDAGGVDAGEREDARRVPHGATRRLRESDRMRRCAGGRGGGRRGGCGRGGRRGPSERTIAICRMSADELVHKRRQCWDEGDFLYESSSSDGEEFFGTSTPAQNGDNDLDDRDLDVDDDDRGDGGDRPRPRSTYRDGDRGPDEAAGHYRDEGDAWSGSRLGGSRRGDGDTMYGDGAGGDHRAASDDVGDGVDDDGPGLIQGSALKRLKRGRRERDTMGSRLRRRHDGVSGIPRARIPAIEQIPVSDDSFSDDAHEERIEQDAGSGHAWNDTQTMEQESMLPPRIVHGVQPDVGRKGVAMQQSDPHGADAVDTELRPPPAWMEGTVVACPGDDFPEGEVSHTPAPEQSVADHIGLACPTDILLSTGSLLVMDEALISLPDLSTLISPGLPHVLSPKPHQSVGIERGPDAFDEFVGDTIKVCPTVFATPTIFRVGRPHEVDLGKAETTTRHHRDGHRSILHRSLSDSFSGAEDGGFVALDAVKRAARPPRSPSHSEHQPIHAAADAIVGVPATDTTDATQQPVVGSSATTVHDRPTVLPTVAFYTSGTTSRGLDEQEVRIVGRPSAPSMGTRSIKTVDGAGHTTMTEYEARPGSVLPTKSDVQGKRATKASFSQARKKASTRKAPRSSPHMRSHLRRSGLVHLEDGEIAPDSDPLDIGGRAATTTNNKMLEGGCRGYSGR